MSCDATIAPACSLPKAKRKFARQQSVHACSRCGKLHRCVMTGAWDTTFYCWEEIK